jgi:DNA-binding protein HU-beta
MEIIMNTVASGEKVQLSGFGNFEKKQRNARTTTHPTTGEKIEIPETAVPFFNPGAIFKEKVER